jgi:PKD repeat protein
VTLTISGPGGTDTEVKGNYIEVSAEYRIYLPLTMRDFTGLTNRQHAWISEDRPRR